MRNVVLIVLATGFLLTWNSENCDAQLFRGRFRSNSAPQRTGTSAPLWVQSAGHVGTHVPQNFSATTKFPVDEYFTPRRPTIARILDGPMTHKYRDPAEVDSRYIGGFHQSHFQNVGIPSGDIGLRGNAYNWRTW